MDASGHVERGELAEFVYGELEEAQRAAIASHLQQCEECREEAARWNEVRRELRMGDPSGRMKIGRRALAGWQLGKVAAAVVLVAGGFAAARWTAPRAMGADEVREQVKAAVANEMSHHAADQKRQQEAYETAMAAVLEKMEGARLADNAALRRDLETVAVRTQATFEQLQVADGPGAPVVAP